MSVIVLVELSGYLLLDEIKFGVNGFLYALLIKLVFMIMMTILMIYGVILIMSVDLSG